MDEDEQTPHRRQRNEHNVGVQSNMNMLNQVPNRYTHDNNIQVVAPVSQPICEFNDNIQINEPFILSIKNETCILISQIF